MIATSVYENTTEGLKTHAETKDGRKINAPVVERDKKPGFGLCTGIQGNRPL
jgi:hypothetical protein